MTTETKEVIKVCAIAIGGALAFWTFVVLLAMGIRWFG